MAYLEKDASIVPEAQLTLACRVSEDPWDWRSRIVADPDVLVGKPVIKGTRIAVELVMDDIHACLAYAREVIRSERMFAVKS